MPNTYSYIAKYQLTSNTTSVDFTSIPNTYSDLLIRFNARGSGSASNVQMRFQYNNNTSNVYYYIFGRADGSSTTTVADLGTEGYISLITSSGAMGGYFSSGEMYISDYAGTTNKISYGQTGGTNDSAPMYTTHVANLWQNTAAITSVKFFLYSSEQFVANSTFYLYGIKNS